MGTLGIVARFAEDRSSMSNSSCLPLWIKVRRGGHILAAIARRRRSSARSATKEGVRQAKQGIQEPSCREVWRNARVMLTERDANAAPSRHFGGGAVRENVPMLRGTPRLCRSRRSCRCSSDVRCRGRVRREPLASLWVYLCFGRWCATSCARRGSERFAAARSRKHQLSQHKESERPWRSSTYPVRSGSSVAGEGRARPVPPRSTFLCMSILLTRLSNTGTMRPLCVLLVSFVTSTTVKSSFTLSHVSALASPTRSPVAACNAVSSTMERRAFASCPRE